MRKPLLVAVLALLPTPVLAATPPEGVPLEVRRGFFTEADIGAFFTLGGENIYSNAQSYLQLGVGYDLPDSDVCRMSDNFTVAFGDVTAAYMVPLAERLYLMPKVAAGLTRMDPAPVGSGDPGLPMTAPNAGLGIGIEYATPMDYFSVGADFMARYIIGPNISTFALFPRVKYTF